MAVTNPGNMPNHPQPRLLIYPRTRYTLHRRGIWQHIADTSLLDRQRVCSRILSRRPLPQPTLRALRTLLGAQLLECRLVRFYFRMRTCTKPR